MRYVRGRVLDVGCGGGRLWMAQVVAGTGWTITRILEDDGPLYCAVLEKEPSSRSTSQSRTGRIAR
jgi:2-polyprenyl-3-methyl-5-hydroxy-6-metoxy-1,4-benzoquinol methylase